jgi:hypothetical protein
MVISFHFGNGEGDLTLHGLVHASVEQGYGLICRFSLWSWYSFWMFGFTWLSVKNLGELWGLMVKEVLQHICLQYLYIIVCFLNTMQ